MTTYSLPTVREVIKDIQYFKEEAPQLLARYIEVTTKYKEHYTEKEWSSIEKAIQ